MSYVHNFIRTLFFILLTGSLPYATAAETSKSARPDGCYSPQSLSEDAVKAYESCNAAYRNGSADVLKICTQAAEKYRNPDIYMVLAGIYSEGKIMAPNLSRHIAMLKKAADMNHAGADAELADIILGAYLRQDKPNLSTGIQGITHLEKAAACGNEKALFRRAEISLHEEFKALNDHDFNGGNEKLKELLLEGNAHTCLYAALWLQDIPWNPEEIRGRFKDNGNRKERRAVFFDYILEKYAEDPAYPRKLLEKAAAKGLEKAYAALAESCPENPDKNTGLRCLSYAQAYALCRNLSAYPAKTGLLEALSGSPEDVTKALNEGEEIMSVRGCR